MTVIGYGDGTVVGWLPSHLSDFSSEFTQEPAPLWRIKYDSAELGEEDLEEVEVDDAATAFQQDEWCKLHHDKVMEVSALALAEKEAAGGGGGGGASGVGRVEGRGGGERAAGLSKEGAAPAAPDLDSSRGVLHLGQLHGVEIVVQESNSQHDTGQVSA